MIEKQKPNLSRKKLATIPLSQDCKSVLLGSVLGDGSLKKESDYVNLRFKMRHSEKYKDYFNWKCSFLKEISTPQSVQRQKPDGYSTQHKLLFQSGARAQLTELWKCVCANSNYLHIQRRWLNHLTPLSLAVWYFDDGSLISLRRRAVICTDGFEARVCNILAQYLEKVWHIKCRVAPIRGYESEKNNYTKTWYYRLWLNNTELRKLFDLILPYAATRTTIKKCLMIYDNLTFQQRWISKMKELLPPEGLVILDSLLIEEFPAAAQAVGLTPAFNTVQVDLFESNVDAHTLPEGNLNQYFAEESDDI